MRLTLHFSSYNNGICVNGDGKVCLFGHVVMNNLRVFGYVFCLCFEYAGTLQKHNISVSLFKALAPRNDPLTIMEQQRVPSYHSKGCSGDELKAGSSQQGNALWRIKCKEDWLKKQGQWFLPADAPKTVQGWLDADDAFIKKFQRLLFLNGSIYS